MNKLNDRDIVRLIVPFGSIIYKFNENKKPTKEKEGTGWACDDVIRIAVIL